MDAEERAAQEREWCAEVAHLRLLPIDELLALPCGELRPSVRLSNCFNNFGIRNLEELTKQWTPEKWARGRGFSRSSLREVRTRLHALDLSLLSDNGTFLTPSSHALNSATIGLFAYGTLMLPKIWHEVVGREVSSGEARLIGYKALCVAGHKFPGLIPAETADVVSGLLYDGISETELQALDNYESSMYDRVVVEVEDGSEFGARAYVYLVREERRGELTDEPWIPIAFRDV